MTLRKKVLQLAIFRNLRFPSSSQAPSPRDEKLGKEKKDGEDYGFEITPNY